MYIVRFRIRLFVTHTTYTSIAIRPTSFSSTQNSTPVFLLVYNIQHPAAKLVGLMLLLYSLSVCTKSTSTKPVQTNVIGGCVGGISDRNHSCTQFVGAMNGANTYGLRHSFQPREEKRAS